MRHISRCINTKLSEICLHAIKLEKISNMVLDYLPDELKQHCHIGSFQNGCLILVTHDAVWASQLRYHLPELRDQLRSKAKLYHLVTIKIVIEYKSLSVKKEPLIPTIVKKSPWRNILDSLIGSPSEDNERLK